jgi:peptidoglycan/LPS O-acetylase OafA/YrhL
MGPPAAVPFDGRYRILDSYRFIAASLICLYHFNKADVLGLQGLSMAFLNIQLMVDFFFTLSGFVIARTYFGRIHDGSSYGRFMWKRFARLYPLHLVTLGVGILGGLVVGAERLPGANPEVFSANAILANLTLTHSMGVTSYGSFNIPSWSISAEMFVYALFPLMALALARLPIRANLALILGYVAVTIAVRHQLGLRDWTLAWFDGGALRAVPTFFAGALIARLTTTRWRSFAPPAWLAHAAFLTAFIPMHFGLRDELTLLCFAATVLLAAAAEHNGRTSRLQQPCWVRLGDASYSLYMWHMPLKVGVFAVTAKLFGAGPGPMWAAAGLSYTLSLMVALLCHRWFEMPVRRWLVGLADRRAAAASLPLAARVARIAEKGREGVARS